MNILVIGGSGFIGTRLVEDLLNAGHTVRIFDKNQSNAFRELVTIGDVRDVRNLTASMSGIDVVYNLAAEHSDDVRPVSLYYDVNVRGAKNIVEAADRNDVPCIIFTSSVAVYGLNRPDPGEDSPPDPFNDYGKSKLQAEEIYRKWAEARPNRSLSIIRPVVIFGEGNKGNVYNLIQQISSNRFIMVGSGNNKKSMGYVGNITEFLVKAISFGYGKHIFNYADKPDMIVKDLVDHIRTELHITKPLLRLPYYLGLTGGYVFDFLASISGKRFPVSSIRIRKFCANTSVSTKALEQSGFLPPFSLNEGLSRMIAHMHKIDD